jgi:hypothetical protein
MFRACFAGDMLLDAEGGKKRADAIQVGDRLWARDEFDPAGPLALKEVEEVFVRSAPLWNLHVAGQRLKTTAEHPFYVVGQGWVPAGMLQIGDRLLTQDGRAVPVEGVAPSGQRVTVYNWRIAEYHTYYVSAAETSPSLWAHNADYNVGAGASEAPTTSRLPWTSWQNATKVTVGGREYAQIGGRLYTQHAVERMMPSGLSGYGRSIAPAYVEEAIRTGTTTTQVVDGVTRTIHSSGTLRVVTEDGGRIIVTVENIH